MKNILKFLFIAFLAVSCSEDDIKNDLADYEKGGFAKFENEIKTTKEFNEIKKKFNE